MVRFWMSGVTILTIASVSLADADGAGGTVDLPVPLVASVAQDDVQKTIDRFVETDPGMKKLFETAAGYAIFPTVGKAGFGIGGARGKGYVYEKGKLIGKATLTQVTLGLQLGGQSYSEVIFFQKQENLDAFTHGNFELSAQVSAVAAAAGASVDAPYEYGVVVFTMAKVGLMFEASVGGQKFDFYPIEER